MTTTSGPGPAGPEEGGLRILSLTADLEGPESLLDIRNGRCCGEVTAMPDLEQVTYLRRGGETLAGGHVAGHYAGGK